MLKIVKTSKPAGSDYPLNKVKDHLRQTSDDVSGLGEDGLIQAYLSAAVDIIERNTWIVSQTTNYVGYLDSFEDFEIFRHKVTSITTIKYYDSGGILQTMSENTDYEVDLHSDFAKVIFESTPTLRDRKFNNIEVTFKAGYLKYHDIPDDHIACILLMVGDFYKTRESTVIATQVTELHLSAGVKSIMMNLSKRVFT